MKTFLIANNLPTRLFTEPDAWVKFVHLYGNIIDECELVLKGDGVQLRFIDRVVVHLEMATKTLETEFGNQVLFRICWTCHGKDGTCGDHTSLAKRTAKRSVAKSRRSRNRVAVAQGFSSQTSCTKRYWKIFPRREYSLYVCHSRRCTEAARARGKVDES